jgi:hypothetical protein
VLGLRTGLRQARDPVGEVDLRDALVRLLVQLPARQRAVLVLRYWEQLTDAEAAAVLGCAEGTVKSARSRGLARLRELAGDWNDTAVSLPVRGRRPWRRRCAPRSLAGPWPWRAGSALPGPGRSS